MKKLMNLFKFLAKEMAHVWFTDNNGKQRVGDIVKVKTDSFIFRPYFGGPEDPSYVFAGKGTHDFEIKFDNIDANSIRFILREDDYNKKIEFTAIRPTADIKETKKSPLSKLKKIFYKSK